MMRGMKASVLAAERLRSHRLTAPAATMTDAAAHMLAVQSQDFLAGRWALGVRTKGAPSLSEVDAAFASGELVRAWTMRGTLHIIPACDLGWVLSVTADRQRMQAATRHRQLGIDAELLSRAEIALRARLRDGGQSRAALFEVLQGVGIDPRDQRGIHVLSALTVNGVLCQGPVVGKEQQFVLVDEHILVSDAPSDPLAELFVRYIDGHGPAGEADFAWWAGLTLGQAREAVARAAGRVREIDDGLFVALAPARRVARADATYALPAFDEYYISYADRTRVCAPEHLAAVGPGKNGMVRATVVQDGRVVGTWTHAAASRGMPAELFDPSVDAEAAASALARFSRFIDA